MYVVKAAEMMFVQKIHTKNVDEIDTRCSVKYCYISPRVPRAKKRLRNTVVIYKNVILENKDKMF